MNAVPIEEPTPQDKLRKTFRYIDGLTPQQKHDMIQLFIIVMGPESSVQDLNRIPLRSFKEHLERSFVPNLALTQNTAEKIFETFKDYVREIHGDDEDEEENENQFGGRKRGIRKQKKSKKRSQKAHKKTHKRRRGNKKSH